MSSPASPVDGAAWSAWVVAAAPKLRYGAKLAVAVALAPFIAFALELDNPSWAGTSAGIVFQPVLGASLRKGVFRRVGTVVGVTAIAALSPGLQALRSRSLAGPDTAGNRMRAALGRLAAWGVDGMLAGLDAAGAVLGLCRGRTCGRRPRSR